MGSQNLGFLDNWLLHIKDVYRMNETELNKIKDYDDRLDRFVELNIMEQVKNLAKVSFVQEEWQNNSFPYIHGWVYGLEDGIIKDLDVTLNSSSSLEEVYQYKDK